MKTAYAKQVLPSAAHRERDLGVLNRAITLPGILGPWLTLAVVGSGKYRPLMLILAAITALAGSLMVLVRSPARAAGPVQGSSLQ